MYFKEPAQLLAVYAALEESNLFYIQNAQETEEALEELRAKYRDTKARLDGGLGVDDWLVYGGQLWLGCPGGVSWRWVLLGRITCGGAVWLSSLARVRYPFEAWL
jgi:hypothetical protein